MLREVHISNLAVIEDATVELGPGLNVFTGQTGAGKSLVLGAIELLLGLRAGAGMLRDGCDQGRVTGVFEVEPSLATAIAGLIDQPSDACEELLITRKLFGSGRTGVSVNGQPATATMVRAVGELLVDIHGQHDHQLLLRTRHQRAIVDGYASVINDGGLLAAYRTAWDQLRHLRDKAESLKASAELRAQRLELAEFQAADIDAASPTAGEMPELEARYAVLNNMATIKGRASQVGDALTQSDSAIVSRLEAMTLVLNELAELDESLEDVAETVRGATLTLGEAAFDLSRRMDRLESEPGELAEVEDRLNTLNRLVSKYGDAMEKRGATRAGDATFDALAPVLALRDELAATIEKLREEDVALDGIEDAVQEAEAEVDRIADQLTQARTTAAREMNPRIEAELSELGMPGARFEVVVEPREGGPGASGADRVEMRVALNVGQSYQPLAAVASGGEISRVMLAIKSIASSGTSATQGTSIATGSADVNVLVFDEIDANIGGRLGSIIGRKMRELANGSGRQVLCITHLPQIAAFGDHHLHIRKAVEGKGKAKQTRTTVVPLTGKARIDELAEMMAGHEATATTRRQARELVSAASS